MQIKNIGEFGLIKKIKGWIDTKDKSVIKGIGDDCAVMEFDRKRYMLFCSDMLVEDVDFTGNTCGYWIGRKAMGVVLSDLAAKAGLPRYALVSLGIPADKDLNFVKALYSGFKHWAKKFNFEIVGGDLSKAKKVIIDISMIGLVEKEKLPLRSNAQLNDIIFITGKLGRPRKEFYFVPRIEEARYLTSHFQINAMIDISDGLLQDLSHILEESKRGAVIYSLLIPRVSSFKDTDKLLNRGEEFELLFTVSPSEAKRLIKYKLHFVYGIGQIVNQKNGFKLIDDRYNERAVKIKGYRHF